MELSEHRTVQHNMVLLDCYEVHIVGHLGFIRGNSILTGEDVEDSQLFAQTRSKLEPHVHGLWKHFRLVTNTGTEIDVIAAGFEFEAVDEYSL